MNLEYDGIKREAFWMVRLSYASKAMLMHRCLTEERLNAERHTPQSGYVSFGTGFIPL